MSKLNLFVHIFFIYFFNYNRCIFLGNHGRIKQFPYVVAVYEDGEYVCGGVIINDSTIITAAHCIADEEDYSPFTYSIRAGRTFHKKGKRHFIKEIIIHESYNELSENDYDIAILKLATILKFSFRIKSIPLQNQGTLTPVHTICQLAGWGLTEKETVSTNLRTVNMSTVSNEECVEYYDTNITPNMICARGLVHPKLGLRTQQIQDGDSGAPLVCNNEVVGIVSFACGYLYPDAPSGFTKISAVYNWIQHNSNDNVD